MWIPDVYQGAPTSVTTFVASTSKIAAFGMAYRLLESGMGGMAGQWQMMLAVLAVISLAIGNLVTVYLGLELLSLSSYALVALNRDAKLPPEAAIKYFVLGALASGMLLYGMSMVYGATGTLALAQLHGAVVQAGMSNLMVFGLIFMIVGISFKLGVAPFHMWIPDVYQGAPTSVTTFVASTSKIAASDESRESRLSATRP
jgi:NADH-quinone oxidoreductase subunit N